MLCPNTTEAEVVKNIAGIYDSRDKKGKGNIFDYFLLYKRVLSINNDRTLRASIDEGSKRHRPQVAQATNVYGVFSYISRF